MCEKNVLDYFIREGNGTPLQYSCLENPMDWGAWWAAVHGVTRSQTRLSDFTFTFHFHALEKEMAAQSSVLAWRIPGTGEPGGLPSMGLHRVGHDWSDIAAAAADYFNDWIVSIIIKLIVHLKKKKRLLRGDFTGHGYVVYSANALWTKLDFNLGPVEITSETGLTTRDIEA